MYGLKMSASSRLVPKTIPKTTPPITSAAKPMTVSSRVTATCFQSGPCAVPSTTQVCSWA